MTQTLHEKLIGMPFPDRLADIRKQRGLTQETLGKSIGLTKLQVYRYEKGTSQPTLDVLKRIAITLHISLDTLVFDTDERDPSEDLKLRFEQIKNMSEEDQKTIKSVLDGMILKHQTKTTIGNFNT